MPLTSHSNTSKEREDSDDSGDGDYTARGVSGASFNLDENDHDAIRNEIEEVDSGESDSSSSSAPNGRKKGKRSGTRKSKPKKTKSAWSSAGSKASAASTIGSKLSSQTQSSKGTGSSKASTIADRDERYLKEFATLAKKRSPLNKKFKFKDKHLVYHGLDPNETASEEVEFESDWAPILIRASGKRMNPRKVQNMLPLLKQKIGQLVLNDPGMKRVIRPVYLKCTEMPRHIGTGFTVCFNYAGLSLTHAEVKSAIESRLREAVQMPYKISNIQFLPLASQLEISGMDNRWLVTLSRNDAKLELIRFGLKLRTTYVTVRDYGDVQRIEIAVWSLLNQDRADTAASGRSVLTTPLSGDPGSALSLLSGRMSLSRDSAGSSGASSALSSVIGSDIDRVKNMLMRRRGTYAEIRSILVD